MVATSLLNGFWTRGPASKVGLYLVIIAFGKLLDIFY
jgi:hypothetical protein